MKTNFKKSLLLFSILIVSVLAYSQETAPKNDDDDEEEGLFNIGEMKNPYEGMMETAMSNSFNTGLSDIGNLERVMSSSADSSKNADILIKYDVILDPNLNVNDFKPYGLWKIAYKEKFDEHRVTPFHKNYDLKLCLNDTMLITPEYWYGTTTCMNNLLFFNAPKFEREKHSLIGALRLDDVEQHIKKTKKKEHSVKLVTDSSGTINQSFLAALYERFGVDDISVLKLKASKLRQKVPLNLYPINDNLMLYFSNATLFYLEKIDTTNLGKNINLNAPIEENYSKVNWKKDDNGYTLITGKNISDFNLFIEEEEIEMNKNGQNRNPKKPKLHITFYPPVVGDNNLSISNATTDSKTGTLSETQLYNSGGPINSVKQIFIPLSVINSPLFTINFISSESKKYSWGMKYKIVYK